MDVLTLEEETNPLTTLPREQAVEAADVVVAPPGAAMARFHGYGRGGQPLISGVPGLPGEIVIARSTVALRIEQVGCAVVILCERGEARRPIIVGALQGEPPPGDRVSDQAPTVSVQVDNDRLVLHADREIVLQCGRASVTLTRAGKVLIQGAYVSSRSSGVNRIKGGSVQIN